MSDLKYQKSHPVSFEQMEGGVILIDLKQGKYFSLNQTPSSIWIGLVEGATLDSVAEELKEQNGIDSSRARHDVETSVNHWLQLGLLQPRACQ